MNAPLHLYEEVLLLALSDQKGTVLSGAWSHQAVGAAVLVELLLGERLRLVPSGRKTLVEPIATRPFGDELLDEWQEKIASDPKRRTVVGWVGKVAGTKGLKGRVARGLARRGVLRVEERKILLIFRRQVYPERDPEPERVVRERLREAVLGNAREVDERTTALLAIAKPAGLLRVAFDKRELKARKARIESIVRGDAAGAAVKELVNQAIAAITVAAIVPTMVS